MNQKTAVKIANRIGRLENIVNKGIERIIDERRTI